MSTASPKASPPTPPDPPTGPTDRHGAQGSSAAAGVPSAAPYARPAMTTATATSPAPAPNPRWRGLYRTVADYLAAAPGTHILFLVVAVTTLVLRGLDAPTTTRILRHQSTNLFQMTRDAPGCWCCRPS